MSTRSSLCYVESLDIHIYRELLDGNYYLDCQKGTILLTKEIAQHLGKRLFLIEKREEKSLLSTKKEDNPNGKSIKN